MPATNLVDLCRQVLTPEAIGSMSSQLHLDPHAVENAAEGAVPALLASLGAAVGRPGGDRQLADAMAQVPQGGTFDDIATYAADRGYGSNGSNPLSGLLSSRTQDSLAHAIGQYAHIGDGDSKKLLGMLGPAVLSQLGRQRMSSGLDAIGLADMLSSQRRKIAGAIPQGLADQMTASGLGDALKDRARTTTVSGVGERVAGERMTGERITGERVTGERIGEREGVRERTTGPTYTTSSASTTSARTETPRVARTTTTTTHTPQRRQNNSWLYWLLGLAALAALAFWAIGNSARDRGVTTRAPATRTEPARPAQPAQPAPSQQQTAPAPQAPAQPRADTNVPAPTTGPAAPAPTTGQGGLTVGGVDLGNELSTSMDSLRSTLGGITDEASAQAALPNLRQATTQFENISSLSRQLPADGRRQLGGSVSSAMPAMEREFDRVLGVPGVSNVLRPVIEGLRTRMQSLAAG